MSWILWTNAKNKTHYRWVTPFERSQKSQHKYIVSKSLSGLKTFPSNSYTGQLLVFYDNILSRFQLKLLSYDTLKFWKDATDKNKIFGAMLIELWKAFHCLLHALLIAKHVYGLDISSLNCFRIMYSTVSKELK